jgi:hypothetical protein
MEDNYFVVDYKSLNTAVLFLIFNRLETTKQVFESIKQAKPPRLYIAADGARDSIDGELQKVRLVRDYVISNIDWNCEVKTLFREHNLGCKLAVSGAIDWFFENEEMGIILEDDCLPSPSFFIFCEKLLIKYKSDMRVWHIGGSNFQNGVKRGDGDFYFSKYNHIWGWASWADRWKNYDVSLKGLEAFISSNVMQTVFIDSKFQKKWISSFEDVKNGKIDTWDFQWQYTVWANNGLSILPNVNMISNIGFGIDATHTSNGDSVMANRHRYNLTEIILPKHFCCDTNADHYEYLAYHRTSLLLRIVRKLVIVAFSKYIIKKK